MANNLKAIQAEFEKRGVRFQDDDGASGVLLLKGAVGAS